MNQIHEDMAKSAREFQNKVEIDRAKEMIADLQRKVASLRATDCLMTELQAVAKTVEDFAAREETLPTARLERMEKAVQSLVERFEAKLDLLEQRVSDLERGGADI